MDVTPALSDGMQVIKSYGDKSFKINDNVFEGSVIISPFNVDNWHIKTYDSISTESLENISDTEILLIGCGEKHLPVKMELKKYFAEKNISVESMTTGAACRTYNVLLAEGRNVTAALIAV